MMGRQLLVLMLFATLTQGIPDYKVFPASPQVMEGAGLVLTVTPTDLPLTSCSVKFAGNSLSFTQNNTSGSVLGVTYWGRGLANGDCGVRIESFNSSHGPSGTSWYFRLQTTDGQTAAPSSTVTILDQVDSGWQDEIVTSLGHPALINCDKGGALFCRLLSPLGEEVLLGPPCQLNVTSVRMQDVGTWACYVSLPGRAEDVVTQFNVSVNSVKTMDIGVVEADGKVNLFCNSFMQDQTLKFCRFERPDGEAFSLQDGASSDRYTYYGGGISQRMCGVSIQKPLEKEDKGVWTCNLGLADGNKTGGFISVMVDKGNRAMEIRGMDTVVLRNGSSLVIKCSTYTPLRYCWLRHPDGRRFTVHPSVSSEGYQYHGDGLELGQCGIEVMVATVEDSGAWVCGMGVDGQSDVSADLQVPIDVIVSESPFIANQSVVSAVIGEWAILGCRSIQGEALQYCSFEAPNGTAYSLTSTNSASDRYMYTGNGLERGDCGILIQTVTVEDLGKWKCAAMLVGPAAMDGEHYQIIILTQPGISTSSTIGITVGVVATALIGVVFLVVRQQRRRRGREVPAEEPHIPLTPPEFPVLVAISCSSEEVDLSEVGSPGTSGEWAAALKHKDS